MVAEASKVEQLELRRQQENPLISKFKEELEIIKFPQRQGVRTSTVRSNSENETLSFKIIYRIG